MLGQAFVAHVRVAHGHTRGTRTDNPDTLVRITPSRRVERLQAAPRHLRPAPGNFRPVRMNFRLASIREGHLYL